MTPKSIKVLLVEDDLGDALWIKKLLEAAVKSLFKFDLQHCSRLARGPRILCGRNARCG